MELFKLTHLTEILQELADNVRQGYVDKLVKNGRPTTENTLASTVTAEVEVNGTNYLAVLNLQEYWKYVEEGTKPHWAPIKPLIHWVEVKPLIPRPEQANLPREKQLESMAYAVRWKIHEEGTKGTHDLRETEDVLLGRYQELIAEALGRDTFEYIEKLIS